MAARLPNQDLFLIFCKQVSARLFAIKGGAVEG